ncbi:MAG: cation-transporting P-type ATPase, partial [Deltaproteobacteria bacterium]
MNTNELSQKGLRVRHSIPGRMRVRVEDIRHNGNRAAALKDWLARQPDVTDSETRPVTGSVILFYDPDKVSPSGLFKLLDQWLGSDQFAEPDHEGQRPRTCGLKCPVCRPSKPERSLFSRLIEVIALTGFMAYVLIREVIFKSPVSQGPFSLTALVAVVGALPLLKHAWENLRQGWHMSLFPFLAVSCVVAIFIGEALAAMEIIWILRIGMLLEDYVDERSRRAIRDILQVAAKNTFIVIEGVEVEIPADQVKASNTVVCHTGEKIPVDGVVLEGEALVDEAPITGRSEPEVRRPEDRVFAGTIVQQGTIFIRAEKVGDETYLCRILHLVEDSLENRAPSEKRADMLASRLMRISVVAVLGTLIITLDPLRAFTVMLVLACPCATVLAASTAVSAALANAARNHILIKGGLYLEHVGEANCFCFDKTGTLTTEVPRVVKVIPRTPRQDPASILGLAATAEAHYQHPMARALVGAAAEAGIKPKPHVMCEFILGRGVRARLDGNKILVGNDKFMDEEGVNVNYFKGNAGDLIARGNTVVYVAKNGKAQGLIAVSNTIRAGAGDVLNWLRKDGVSSLHLVTGDTGPVAKAMAEDFEFDDYQAVLLPKEKARYVEQLETRSRQVVMVGDGVNDALALASSSVGVAMGAGGAEVAIEAADIALVNSDLECIVRLRQLSHETIKTIEQNHWLAVSTNIGGVILGAAGMLPP